MGELLYKQTSGMIIGAAIEVHNAFGRWMLESAYEFFLAQELERRGCLVKRQVPVSLTWKGDTIQHAYRIDLLVNDQIIVELKVVDQISPEHEQQLLTYMRNSNRRVGMILNFRKPFMLEGIHRFIL